MEIGVNLATFQQICTSLFDLSDFSIGDAAIIESLKVVWLQAWSQTTFRLSIIAASPIEKSDKSKRLVQIC